MKKISVLIFCYIYMLNAEAQQLYNDFTRYNYLFQNDSSGYKQNTSIGTFGEYSLNATGITNKFFLDFLNGEFIDKESITHNESRLWKINRYGYQLNLNVSGKAALDSSMAVIASVSARQHNSAKFSKDLFTLAFRGNKGFAGQTAKLDPLQFTSFDYQSFSLGMDKSLAKNKLHIWGGLSAIRAGNFRFARADKLSLYTEQDGAYIEANADFEFRQTGGAPGIFSDKNGIGASLFMGLDYQIGKSVLGLSVSDLGFIKYDPMKTYQADQLLRFEGKEIESILSFNDTLFDSYTADTLATETGIKISEKKYIYKLPTFIRLTYVYKLSSKLTLINALEILTNVGAMPEISVKPVYAFSNSFFVSSTLSYGQFGAFDLELGLAAKLNSGFSGLLSITGAEFLFARNKASGQGISIGIYKAF